MQEGLGLEMYDFGARLQDSSLGRWFVVDALAEHPNQIDKSPYAYAWNNPIFYTDPDGNCPLCPGGGLFQFFSNVIPGAVQDNNSTDAHVAGIGLGIVNGQEGFATALLNPRETFMALVNLASPTSGGTGIIMRSQAGQAIVNDVDAVVNGNGLQRGEVFGRGVFDASVGFATAQVGGTTSSVVRRVMKNSKSGTAIVYKYDGTPENPFGHYKVETTYKGKKVTTDQVIDGHTGDTTIRNTTGDGASAAVEVKLPNAKAAQNYQQSQIGKELGPYDKRCNSCQTHVGNVLREGGVKVPKRAILVYQFFKSLFGG